MNDNPNVKEFSTPGGFILRVEAVIGGYLAGYNPRSFYKHCPGQPGTPGSYAALAESLAEALDTREHDGGMFHDGGRYSVAWDGKSIVRDPGEWDCEHIPVEPFLAWLREVGNMDPRGLVCGQHTVRWEIDVNGCVDPIFACEAPADACCRKSSGWCNAEQYLNYTVDNPMDVYKPDLQELNKPIDGEIHVWYVQDQKAWCWEYPRHPL